MVYVTGSGTVQQRQSFLRLSLIPDLVWGLLNTVTAFFHTMISQEAADAYQKRGKSKSGGAASGRGGSGGPGGPGGPGNRRLGGINHNRPTVNVGG
mmetsp:Transcript_13086/g.15802  ORF Transcript_13086/g.15802 Transcript_13086/m.15802 type:complete len:96 (-) Transcript_13086:565-852(-)|eukprot:CAMPEP_0197857146 /NCGR_PEP_ID=MMETSP1438-20131217/29943_1 /TAXON_ID=1461541 /ORGANISM="Pterosperma sp., Strain CCMP1384" /LENGTH=95 /DNA_ID=CAMNT_0043472875 /DNA_START=65 /DNA_END=352 /DNA_ORIENTATION=-